MKVFRIHKRYNSVSSGLPLSGYYTYLLQYKCFFKWRTLHEYKESQHEDAYRTLAELQGYSDPHGRPKIPKPEPPRMNSPKPNCTPGSQKHRYPSVLFIGNYPVKIPSELLEAASKTKTDKPAIGILSRDMYEKISREHRFKDLIEAINRYVESGQQIPVPWIKEFNETVNLLNEQKKG